MMRSIAAAFLGSLLGFGAPAVSAGAMHVRPMQAAPTIGAEIAPVLVRRGFYVVNGIYYYNGYRGVVVARPGYRYYKGYWFPAAAFAAGVAAGAVIAAPPPPRPAARLAAAHVRWCHAHYVSYRARDNTYQPYVGPRRPCLSPYN